MGFFDWLRYTAGQVTEAIRLSSREVIPLHPDIAPPEEFFPSSVEELEEWAAAHPRTQRFISTAEIDQALRLGRGVQSLTKLTNVYLRRVWTLADPSEIELGPGQQISVRSVHIAPDGTMFSIDVAFPTQEGYTEAEWLKRASSALDDEIASRYGVSGSLERYGFLKETEVSKEFYVQDFPSIR